MTGLFEALGDATRRRILVLLSAGERPAGALVADARVSQPAVSQHLRVLLDAGLVSVRAEGRQRVYAVDADGLLRAQAWLGALLDPLAGARQPLDALATEVARGRRGQRAAREPETPGSPVARTRATRHG